MCASRVSPIRPDGYITGLQSPILAKGKEAAVTDVDGNGYIDFSAAGGAHILGYLNERVSVAINKAVSKGCQLGSPSEVEVLLADRIHERLPFVEQARFVHSRFEAIGDALALARHTTNRSRIISFDAVPGTDEHGIHLRHNDTESVRETFQAHGPTIAAALVQPVFEHGGPIAPLPGFLEALRSGCDLHDALLIFDETTSGFRIGPGGAAAKYGVEPDLTILGSHLAGGLLLSFYGGRQHVMNQLALIPELATRFPASLPALAACVATLEELAEQEVYESLEQRSSRLEEGIRSAARSLSANVVIRRVGSMVGLVFSDDEPPDQNQQTAKSYPRFATFYTELLQRGVHITCSATSCWFVSVAHTDVEIDQAIEIVRESLEVVQNQHAAVTAM